MDDELRRAAATKLQWQHYLLAEGERFGRELPPGRLGELPPVSHELERYYETQRLAFTAPVFYGRLLYVSSDSCDVLQETVDSLDHDLALDPSWFPFTVGFVYFQRELELPQLVVPNPEAKRGLAFRASGWSCFKFDNGNIVVPQDPIDTEVVMWATMIESGSVFFPLSFLSWNVGQSLTDALAEKEANDEPWERYRDATRHELCYAAAFLLTVESANQRQLPLEWDRAGFRGPGDNQLQPPETITTLAFRRPH